MVAHDHFEHAHDHGPGTRLMSLGIASSPLLWPMHAVGWLTGDPPTAEEAAGAGVWYVAGSAFGYAVGSESTSVMAIQYMLARELGLGRAAIVAGPTVLAAAAGITVAVAIHLDSRNRGFQSFGHEAVETFKGNTVTGKSGRRTRRGSPDDVM